MKGTQLCWSCVNAVPSLEHGCPWSERFEPVEGWTAEETVLATMRDGRAFDLHSFLITACPLYEEG